MVPNLYCNLFSSDLLSLRAYLITHTYPVPSNLPIKKMVVSKRMYIHVYDHMCVGVCEYDRQSHILHNVYMTGDVQAIHTPTVQLAVIVMS